mgnify:CR=1 FL=1
MFEMFCGIIIIILCVALTLSTVILARILYRFHEQIFNKKENLDEKARKSMEGCCEKKHPEDWCYEKTTTYPVVKVANRPINKVSRKEAIKIAEQIIKKKK